MWVSISVLSTNFNRVCCFAKMFNLLLFVLSVELLMLTLCFDFIIRIFFFQNANTTEIDPNTEHKLVVDMPEFTPEEKGGTMRLGARTSIFRDNDKSVISKSYNRTCVDVTVMIH